jgi:hypothetical protein
MRKRIINSPPQSPLPADETWLELEEIAQVEITSEESSRPVEGALLLNSNSGWRAAHPGEQTLRLVFDEPMRIRRIRLVFVETERERTQEFVLRWSPDGGRSFREIVRQQWNFSPPDSARELEDYGVELDGVMMLELSITPDKSGGGARASLEQLRLGS